MVVFRLRPGVTREAFLEASRPTQAWLCQQPGMLERTLLEPTGDGTTWVDTVRWASIEEAEAAMAGFASAQGNGDFEQMIDPESVQMLHLRVVPAEVVGGA